MPNNVNIIQGLQKNNATAIISGDYIRKSVSEFKVASKTTSVLTQHKIMLFILGMIERVDFAQTPVVILGRFDRHLKTDDQLDLSNYGAIERGVSRVHCKLEFKDSQVIVTDLGSANGTYVSGVRLDSGQSYTLKKGEELTLGRLPIQFIADR